MKQTSIVKLLIVAAALQSCAGTVDPRGSGSHMLLDGSAKFGLTGETCSRGMGLIRFFEDTQDGNKIKYNAKLAMTDTVIDDKAMNVYSLIQESSDPSATKAKSKYTIVSSSNSIEVKVSQIAMAPTTEKSTGNGKNAMTDAKSTAASPDTNVTLNTSFGLHYNSKSKYYENVGAIDSAFLALEEGVDPNRVIHSVYVKIPGDKEFTQFPVPDTLDAEDLSPSLDDKFSATIGTDLAISVRPKDTAGQDTNLFVQFANNLPKSAGATYNFLKAEGTDAGGQVMVPTKQIKAGSYDLYVVRFQATPYNVKDKNGGTFCMEVGTGVRGKVDVAAAAAKK